MEASIEDWAPNIALWVGLRTQVAIWLIWDLGLSGLMALTSQLILCDISFAMLIYYLKATILVICVSPCASGEE